MTRCAVAVGAGMAALYLLSQSAGSAGNVPARVRPTGTPLLRSDSSALSEVQL